jgi:hypothetical protein
MSPEAHARLVELDALTRDARELYGYAAAVLPASTLRDRCQRLAQAKSELVALLALRLPLGAGRTPDAPQLAPSPWLRERVAAALARVRIGLATPDPARIWDELQRVEAAVADACRAQALESGDADCRRELGWLLPLVERGRDEFAPAARDVQLG